MYTGLQHAHSGLRWVLLIALIAAIITGYQHWKNGAAFDKKTRVWALVGLALTHTQFIIGLILYFISPKVMFTGAAMKNAVTRFFTAEHSFLMILAVIIITIGYARGKRKSIPGRGFKTIFWYYLIGLAIMLVGIPWPFRGLGAGWF